MKNDNYLGNNNDFATLKKIYNKKFTIFMFIVYISMLWNWMTETNYLDNPYRYKYIALTSIWSIDQTFRANSVPRYSSITPTNWNFGSMSNMTQLNLTDEFYGSAIGYTLKDDETGESR